MIECSIVNKKVEFKKNMDLNKKSLIKEYKDNLEIVKKCAKTRGFSDEEIESILKESLKNLEKNRKLSQKNYQKVLKISALIFLLLSIIIYVLLNVHTPTSSMVLRNVQSLTYPALKFVRILSLPIIKLFPSLTDLYAESCLIKNPYFYLKDPDCSPCEGVYSVFDLTGIAEIDPYKKVSEGVPLIIKTNQRKVLWKDLKELYENHTKELIHTTGHIEVKNLNINSKQQDLFKLADSNMSSNNVHIKWRMNDIIAARIIRKLFPRPDFFPDRSGQEVERFIYIDGPSAEPYILPNTECNYVFVIQGSGERHIKLIPSDECKKYCSTISVNLKPSYVLLYDWWYWRPVSIPGNIDSSSISYINSYC